MSHCYNASYLRYCCCLIFQDLVCRQFESLALMVPCLQTICCDALPEADCLWPHSPSRSAPGPCGCPFGLLLGRAVCPNTDVRVKESLLAKLHRAMATQACLSIFPFSRSICGTWCDSCRRVLGTQMMMGRCRKCPSSSTKLQ